MCFFGAKKPLPLFFLSGCAAWWGEGVFPQIFIPSRDIYRTNLGFIVSFFSIGTLMTLI